MKAPSVGRILVVILEGTDLMAGDKNGEYTYTYMYMYNHVRTCISAIDPYDMTRSSPSFSGKSDPYCEVTMGAQEHKTKVIPNTLNPKWNHSMQFTIRDPRQDVLCISVYDRDFFSPNGQKNRNHSKNIIALKTHSELTHYFC